MKLNIELDGACTQELAFFADTVLWSGSIRGETVSGRLMLDDVAPDPGDKCLELTTLTVHDECARAVNARVETCPDGGRRIAGRLELPVTAELTDDCGNTYKSSGWATYDVSIAADGLEDACGEVAFSCEAGALTVQATSPECVNYQLTLDVTAYLLRSRLVRIRAEEHGEEDCGARQNGAVVVRGSDMTYTRRAARPAVQYSAPVSVSVRSSSTLDALTVGAARSCGSRATEDAQSAADAARADAPAANQNDDDPYRTVVKMPTRRRRR